MWALRPQKAGCLQHKQHSQGNRQHHIHFQCTMNAFQQHQVTTTPTATTSEWNRPLADQAAALHVPPAPAVIALGKFDALHRGHQALAVACAIEGGQPWLVSFTGMAEVLGWPQRLPLVAPQDRPNVLAGWAAVCRGRIPQELLIPFREIRSLSPGRFVALLAEELQVQGVVVGSNYRFGYKAAGDTKALQDLCGDYEIQVTVLDLVGCVGSSSQDLEGTVSSTKVRDALASGHFDTVAELLGRPYKLVAQLTQQQALQALQTTVNRASANASALETDSCAVRLPPSSLCNQPPGPGQYAAQITIHSSTCSSHVLSSRDVQLPTSSSNGAKVDSPSTMKGHAEMQQDNASALGVCVVDVLVDAEGLCLLNVPEQLQRQVAMFPSDCNCVVELIFLQ